MIAVAPTETVSTLTIPHRFVPFVGLAAGDFFGEIHPLETWPGMRSGVEGRDVEPPLGIVSDDAVRRSEIANTPRQSPRVDPRDPDESMGSEPGGERLRRAIARRFGGRCTQDEPAHRRGRGFDVLPVRTDIADVRKSEDNDLTGIGRVGQDLLIAGDRGIEADLAGRCSDRAEAAAPKHRAIGEDERGVAVGRSRGRVAHRAGVLVASRSLPGSTAGRRKRIG